MRLFLKWALRLVALLVVVAVLAGLWKREELTRLMAVNSLFAPEKIVDNFSNMNKAFLWTELTLPNAAPSPLPKGPDATLPAQTQDWIETRDVTALVVLKDGQIVHETYYKGTKAGDRRISWSVAKSYLSALMGVLLEDGSIASIDDPLTKYAPSLIGTAYDGASIRNVLNMASGVTFDEDYLDKSSDINRMGRVLALGGTMDGFTTELTETFAEPGQTWQYVSIDTHVLSMVIRGATGRSIVDLMSEKIIGPMGLETAPYYLTDGVGVAFVLGGLNMTTRDYARMGQMFLQRGRLNGQQIVPAAWVDASTTPTAPTAPGAIGYGFQWWIPKGATKGEFMARGVYGQYIYINRPLGVVIATNAADRNFRDAGVADENIAMFRAIASAL
ncbi:serine hydrolase domain-containing protein [Litoreibacter arenae]|uniref:Beta-lactamase class C and other penicillin binding protein n=1 Tax=Litoreibacter arenae DSM 19593 TaxID=1123360 RepID=S9QC26_9RHOB|nr:serine hydrolase [Litoreibacter arenae]EPX77123.1 Beta-lactamase class C and other penicillin binding protein [Litoreibacter arenae DSM 19593]